MDLNQLKQDVIDYAHTIGIDSIGFTTADPFDEMKQKLVDYHAKGYASGFEESDIALRTEPKLTLPTARSIIAIAVGYPNKLKGAPKSTRGDRRGMFARASWGQDYHSIMRKRLDKLADYLRDRVDGVEIQSMVDTGALSDRAVAERAGLGYVGRNGFVINPELGTWTYLGEMLVSVPFPPDDPLLDSCGDCTICVDRCPTGALVGDGQLNSQKCISFLTQTKGYLADEYRYKIGNRLYGCDTCQQVCPRNKGINTQHEDIVLEPEILKPRLVPLLKMSNKEFKHTYGHLAGAWRGKKPIQRNAIVALAHFKEESAIPDLQDVALNDPRPMIRGTAYWAIGQIQGEDARGFIEQQYQNELEEVQQEMLKGLETRREQ
ncbi:tRNA epoxyqueuosine(34) reductase QueG [Staphylococcus pseudoxylosus]|uniref:tRNA epoxyqueuosine(34) reductase QueG n=1 Tax=Staphylococcus pseudoxylosus TaxID=2282419 RepID=A0AAQ0MJW4_9STAP|nr:tRNA epoxyqueuosine(34) reductase QueG [Staphylococcus pseudoxylosus]PTI81409.1 tRNA epoxyqueuosine(34) reductase QueG [Staphylococcus xylosus]MBM2658236.1 tRNA epoxyqueuosine(34) reductase QueG [Staphylococcus pseudoxylosus]MCE5003291.1 tRNA epoxyqueuosine(34) reductase QueG [Staphylococcus pseudoxylosus]MDW8547150.1 tRNA epoxyqueuosine(34) reductase QueG [Staphylococcus pseudoxylosus]MEB5783351.1 tRNA epoxyqueuosine(34) reductase QueG [Staphylococcus pseudoxylosus]